MGREGGGDHGQAAREDGEAARNGRAGRRASAVVAHAAAATTVMQRRGMAERERLVHSWRCSTGPVRGEGGKGGLWGAELSLTSCLWEQVLARLCSHVWVGARPAGEW